MTGYHPRMRSAVSAVLTLALGLAACTTPPPKPVTGPPASFAGNWKWVCCDGKYSGTMTLTQEGATVKGTMTATALEESPDVTGTVDGTLLDLERKGGGGTLHYMLRGDSTSNALSGFFEGAHDPMAATDFLARRVSRPAAN